MIFYVYILQSHTDGSLYTGQSQNLLHRLKQHQEGLVRSTRAKRPLSLVYFETFDTRALAMNREWELKKKWNIIRKKKLILNFDKSRIHELFNSPSDAGGIHEGEGP